MSNEMQVYIKSSGEGLVGQYVDMVILPTGEAVFHNPITHTIEFEPMREYIGYPFTMYRDGEATAICQLEGISRDFRDVETFSFSVIEDYKGEFVHAS